MGSVRKSIEATAEIMALELKAHQYHQWVCYLFECLEAEYADEHKHLVEFEMTMTIEALTERLQKGEW